MLGAITTRDVLLHPLVTVRSFGWGVFFRAVLPGRGQTFLSVLQRNGCFETLPPHPAELIDRCVRLERQAMRIYETLAQRFSSQPAAQDFFAELARQERGHAEMLDICRAALRWARWDEACFRLWQDYLPMLEDQMCQTRRVLPEATSLDDALRLVLQVESSELNRVFGEIVRATRSPFISRIGVFHKAVWLHIAFICECIPRIAPHLESACHELRARLVP